MSDPIATDEPQSSKTNKLNVDTRIINKKEYQKIHDIKRDPKIVQFKDIYNKRDTTSYPFVDFYSQAGTKKKTATKDVPIIRRNNSVSSVDFIEQELSYFTMEEKKKKGGIKSIISLFNRPKKETKKEKIDNKNFKRNSNIYQSHGSIKFKFNDEKDNNKAIQEVDEVDETDHDGANGKETRDEIEKKIELEYAKGHIKKFNTTKNRFVNSESIQTNESVEKNKFVDDIKDALKNIEEEKIKKRLKSQKEELDLLVKNPRSPANILSLNRQKPLGAKPILSPITPEKIRLPSNRETIVLRPSHVQTNRRSTSSQIFNTELNNENNVFRYDNDAIATLNAGKVETRSSTLSATSQPAKTPEEQKRRMRRSVEEYYLKELRKENDDYERNYREYVDRMNMYGYNYPVARSHSSLSQRTDRNQFYRYAKPTGSEITSVVYPDYRNSVQGSLYEYEVPMRRVSYYQDNYSNPRFAYNTGNFVRANSERKSLQLPARSQDNYLYQDTVGNRIQMQNVMAPNYLYTSQLSLPSHPQVVPAALRRPYSQIYPNNGNYTTLRPRNAYVRIQKPQTTNIGRY